MNLVLTIAAATLAVVVVSREFRSEPVTRSQQSLQAAIPTFIEDWQTIAASGLHMGSPSASVRVLEFMDVECPFCRQLHLETMKSVSSAFADTVAAVFVHYPLPGHRFAMPGARTLECARGHENVGRVADLLFAKQDSFGLLPWIEYLRQAGVRVDASIENCVRSAAAVSAIEDGVEAGKRLGIQGTPSLMLNGWLYPRPLTASELKQAITALVRNPKTRLDKLELSTGSR